MQRYQESLQQQSFPIIEARIITSAYPPMKPSAPKKLPMIFAFLFLGGAAGAAIGALREFREKGFLREEQVRSEVGVECLGVVPFLKGASPSRRAQAQLKKKLGIGNKSQNSGKSALIDEPASVRKPSKTGFLVQSANDSEVKNEFDAGSEIMSFAMDNPFSAFTETLMALKISADIRASGVSSKIIGMVSALPSEGKSVVSKNFASVLAKLKAKTLLIDADVRSPALTRQLTPYATAGLIEAVIGSKKLDELVLTENSSGLHFLPSVSSAKVSHSSELLASLGMRSLLDEAQETYDYIIIDLPPFGPVSDARAISPQIHAFAYVLEWRKTPRKIARNLLESNKDLKRKCLGVILNKVDVDRIELFEEKGSRYYYYEKYSKSYYLEKS